MPAIGACLPSMAAKEAVHRPRHGYSAQLFERSLPEAALIVRRLIERWALHEPQPAFRSLQRLVGNQLGVLATSAEDG